MSDLPISAKSWLSSRSVYTRSTQNAGIRPLNARYKTTCIHLEHPRGYADPAIMARNKAILRDTAKSGRVRAERGIQELLDEGYKVDR